MIIERWGCRCGVDVVGPGGMEAVMEMGAGVIRRRSRRTSGGAALDMEWDE